MNSAPSQTPALHHRDGFETVQSYGGAEGGNQSSMEFQSVEDKNGLSSNKDSERGPAQLTGKYAKYAGEPPDGGLKAWTVIVGTCLTTYVTLGYVSAWGIFQEYYEEVMLPHDSPSDIAWIGSVQYALIFFPGLVVGRMFDLGHFRIPYLVAGCLQVACTFLTAECKVWWQFFLAQGLGIGIASGMMFGTTFGIVSHWFKKRKGLALGVTAIGSAVGGMIFPVAAQSLIPEVGFKWTMRTFGFMLFALHSVINLTIDRRLPPVNAQGGMFNWVAFRNPAYAIYCMSGTATFLGLYTVLTYIPVTAIQVGVSSDFAFYLVAIVNGVSAFGRVASGYLGDRIGALNIMIPNNILAAVVTIVWPLAKTKGSLVAIAIVYGYMYGTYVALLPIPALSMGAITDAGRRMGMFLSFAALGALGGPPISGAISARTGGFQDVGWWGGAILLFSACLLTVTRYLLLGKVIGKA